LSVGIEHIDDILIDLDQALGAAVLNQKSLRTPFRLYFRKPPTESGSGTGSRSSWKSP